VKYGCEIQKCPKQEIFVRTFSFDIGCNVPTTSVLSGLILVQIFSQIFNPHFMQVMASWCLPSLVAAPYFLSLLGEVLVSQNNIEPPTHMLLMDTAYGIVHSGLALICAREFPWLHLSVRRISEIAWGDPRDPRGSFLFDLQPEHK
jgi:hypothetical protein